MKFVHILVGLTLAIASASAMAQSGADQVKGGEGRGTWEQHRKDKGFPRFGQGVLSKLNLTPEQKARIDRATKPRLEEIKKISDSDLSREVKRERIGKLVREIQTEIQATLTPSQREEMKKLMEEARKRRKDGDRDGKPKVPPPSF